MTKQTKTAVELEDKALDAANGGTDALRLLAQVNHLQTQGSSVRAPSTANNKGIIAVLIGL